MELIASGELAGVAACVGAADVGEGEGTTVGASVMPTKGGVAEVAGCAAG
jgi:hypothetical protein